MRALIGLLATFAVLLGTPAATQAASYTTCDPVRDPYPGTRYEGVDLTWVRGLRVSCPTSRRVARQAHRRALGQPVPPSGVRRFRWHGWRVTGDVRPAHDRYIARQGDRRVRWRF